MSATKYTLGPWMFAWQDNDELQVSFACVVVGDRVTVIGHGAKNVANARLIAAAPELLDALIAATAALDNVGMQDTYINFDQVRDAKAKARAAIAKATGETP